MSQHYGKDGNKQANQSHKQMLVNDLRNRLQAPIRVKAGNRPASILNPVFGPKRPSQRLGKLTVGRDHAVDPIHPDASSGKPADTFHWDPILKGVGIRASATGRQVYLVQYRERGQTRRRVIGSVADLDPRTARRKARQILSAVKVGARRSRSVQPAATGADDDLRGLRRAVLGGARASLGANDAGVKPKGNRPGHSARVRQNRACRDHAGDGAQMACRYGRPTGHGQPNTAGAIGDDGNGRDDGIAATTLEPVHAVYPLPHTANGAVSQPCRGRCLGGSTAKSGRSTSAAVRHHPIAAADRRAQAGD